MVIVGLGEGGGVGEMYILVIIPGAGQMSVLGAPRLRELVDLGYEW